MAGARLSRDRAIQDATQNQQNISSSFFPRLLDEPRAEAAKRGTPLRVMFQDEARFGRISEPYACWAPHSIRPDVPAQIIREYTYLYGAVSPKDGRSDFLILPAMDGDCMNVFLERFLFNPIQRIKWKALVKLARRMSANLKIEHFCKHLNQKCSSSRFAESKVDLQQLPQF